MYHFNHRFTVSITYGASHVDAHYHKHCYEEVCSLPELNAELERAYGEQIKNGVISEISIKPSLL